MKRFPTGLFSEWLWESPILPILAIFSFLAIADPSDERAMESNFALGCEELTTVKAGQKEYVLLHCPDEAFDRVRSVGNWVAPVREVPKE